MTSPQFSGSFSDCYGEQVTEFDDPTQAISTELSDSGTEGDNEGPASCNDLRSHTRKQCQLSAKRAGHDDTSDTDDSMMPGKRASNQDLVVDKKAEDMVAEDLGVEVEVEVMVVEVEDMEVEREDLVAEDKVRDIPQIDLVVCLQIYTYKHT